MGTISLKSKIHICLDIWMQGWERSQEDNEIAKLGYNLRLWLIGGEPRSRFRFPLNRVAKDFYVSARLDQLAKFLINIMPIWILRNLWMCEGNLCKALNQSTFKTGILNRIEVINLIYIWSSPSQRWNLDLVLRLIYGTTFLAHFHICFAVPRRMFLWELSQVSIATTWSHCFWDFYHFSSLKYLPAFCTRQWPFALA